MNYLLEIVIFNVVIFTICGISMAKKGKLGMIQEYPKAIQDRCRELGLIQESSDKLTKKATIGKIGFFIGYMFLQTALAYYIGGARTFFEGWLHGYIMWVAEMWFDALVVDCIWFCHSKKMIIPGTEDLVDAYHDYWHHIKYAVIGMFTQAVIALPVGLFVMLLSKI